MPMLFYGTPGKRTRRALFGTRVQPIETRVFDSFKVEDLAPYHGKFAVANLWWFEERNHTAVSWHDEVGTEQTVWMPQLLRPLPALELARHEFATVMPGPLVFRLNNERRPYLYE